LSYTDTGCTYGIQYRIMQRNGVSYEIRGTFENSKGPGEFTRKFFETFTPKDTVIGVSLFSDNVDLLLADLNSADSATRAEAVESINEAELKPEHFKKWTVLIDTLQPSYPDYFKFKSQLIEMMDDIKT